MKPETLPPTWPRHFTDLKARSAQMWVWAFVAVKHHYSVISSCCRLMCHRGEQYMLSVLYVTKTSEAVKRPEFLWLVCTPEQSRCCVSSKSFVYIFKLFLETPLLRVQVIAACRRLCDPLVFPEDFHHCHTLTPFPQLSSEPTTLHAGTTKSQSSSKLFFQCKNGTNASLTMKESSVST